MNINLIITLYLIKYLAKNDVTEDQKSLIARHSHFRNLIIIENESYTHVKDLFFINKSVVKLTQNSKINNNLK